MCRRRSACCRRAWRSAAARCIGTRTDLRSCCCCVSRSEARASCHLSRVRVSGARARRPLPFRCRFARKSRTATHTGIRRTHLPSKAPAATRVRRSSSLYRRNGTARSRTRARARAPLQAARRALRRSNSALDSGGASGAPCNAATCCVDTAAPPDS